MTPKVAVRVAILSQRSLAVAVWSACAICVPFAREYRPAGRSGGHKVRPYRSDAQGDREARQYGAGFYVTACAWTKYSTVRRTPSSYDVFRSKPRISRARVISANEWRMSP